jgi:hypothetical protein
VPLSANPDTNNFSFGTPDPAAHLSAHFVGDMWHPASDYWESNATGSCATLAKDFPDKVAANPSVNVPEEWCPHVPASAQPYLDAYSNRINLCALFNPNLADSHWPLIAPRVPYATLYGYVNSHLDESSAKISGGDYVSAGLSGTFVQMHEGLDFDWLQKPAATDPDYKTLVGNYDPFTCYGQWVFSKDTQLPLSCNDDLVRLCGKAAADGCDPFQQAVKRAEAAEADACSCKKKHCDGSFLSALCTGGSCLFNELTVCPLATLANTARFFDDLYSGYFASIFCNAAAPGVFCPMGYTINKVPTEKHDFEEELEYNITFGAKDLGLGLQHSCGVDTPPLPSQCQWDVYDHDNWAFTDLCHGSAPQGCEPAVGTDPNGFPEGDCNPKPSDVLNLISPFSVAPGIFESSPAVWGKTAKVVGVDPNFASCTMPTVTPVPDEVRMDFPTLNPPKPEHPFRVEMLGDLIVDCGHNPLHTEIHPPVAISMHLGGTAGRYSLFGWRRMASNAEDPQDELFVDLWPATIKPSAGSHLVMNVIDNHGIRKNTEDDGVWNCFGYPFGSTADRYRCILIPSFRFGLSSAQDDKARCASSPRMLPSCQDGVAGGLVEVSWQ